MTQSRLSVNQRAALAALLPDLAHLIARQGDAPADQIALLLRGAGGNPLRAAQTELRYWVDLLRRYHRQPDAAMRETVAEALLLRDVPEPDIARALAVLAPAPEPAPPPRTTDAPATTPLPILRPVSVPPPPAAPRALPAAGPRPDPPDASLPRPPAAGPARDLVGAWIVLATVGWGLGHYLSYVTLGWIPTWPRHDASVVSQDTVGTLLMATILGLCQWFALRVSHRRSGWWVGATALGGLLGAWVSVGFIDQHLQALSDVVQATQVYPWQAGLYAGVRLGLGMTLLQWAVARGTLRTMGPWMLGATASVVAGVLTQSVLEGRYWEGVPLGRMAAGSLVYGISSARAFRLLPQQP